jgi:hypothetical protein
VQKEIEVARLIAKIIAFTGSSLSHPRAEKSKNKNSLSYFVRFPVSVGQIVNRRTVSRH